MALLFNPPGRLAGKVAIITGSSSGVGRGIALAFAREGCKMVVCCDLRPTSSAVAAAPDSLMTKHDMPEGSAEDHLPTHEVICTRYGPNKAIYLQSDVAKETVSGGENGTESLGMSDVVYRTVKEAGRLDIMVNCAGVGVFAIPTHEMSLETWNRCMSVNSTGPFLGMKHSIAQFIKQDPDEDGFRGAIVNITSIGSVVALRECGAYCASKASVASLSRTIAVDYASKDIQTPMLQPSLDQEIGFKNYLDTWIPSQRLGRPTDVAGAAVWLATGKESGYVTGTSLVIDGGFTAR